LNNTLSKGIPIPAAQSLLRNSGAPAQNLRTASGLKFKVQGLMFPKFLLAAASFG